MNPKVFFFHKRGIFQDLIFSLAQTWIRICVCSREWEKGDSGNSPGHSPSILPPPKRSSYLFHSYIYTCASFPTMASYKLQTSRRWRGKNSSHPCLHLAKCISTHFPLQSKHHSKFLKAFNDWANYKNIAKNLNSCIVG